MNLESLCSAVLSVMVVCDGGENISEDKRENVMPDVTGCDVLKKGIYG